MPFEIPENWCWVTGNDIFNAMISCKPQGDEFKYIDIDSIDNKNHRIISPKILKVKNAPSRASRYTQAGDVLFSMVRPYLKNIALVEEGSCIASTGFFVCSPMQLLTSEYCYYMMLSDYVVYGLNQYMKGDNSPSINNGHITSWLYPIPPINEQLRITTEIKKWFVFIDDLESEEIELESLIKQVKSKILDLAISGKLVPQDPNDEPAIELLKRINPDFEPCDNSHYENLPQGWVKAGFKDIYQTISSRDYQIQQRDIINEGLYPVVSQSSNYIEGYYNNKEKLLDVTAPMLIFGDHTRVVKYIDFPFVIGADGVKVIKPLINDKFAYYLLLYTSQHIDNKGYSRHFQFIAKANYCIPPLREQTHIVKTLETLFETINTITAEL